MIIIYGGSFNPPTLAHLEIAFKALNYGSKLIFAITDNHAFQKELIPIEYRIQMLSLALQKDVRFKKNQYSITEMGTYTYDYLQTLDPNEEYSILIGSDILPELYKWKDYEKLIAEYTFIVAIRENWIDTKTISKYLTSFLKFNIPQHLMNISSSLIRYMLKTNEVEKIPLAEYIPDSIIDLIKSYYKE